MIQPHTSARYGLLIDYTIVAIHSIAPEGDEMLASEAITSPAGVESAGVGFHRPALIPAEQVLYMMPNFAAAVRLRKGLRKQDAEGETR